MCPLGWRLCDFPHPASTGSQSSRGSGNHQSPVDHRSAPATLQLFSLYHWLFCGRLLLDESPPYVASLIGHYEGDYIATIVFSASLGLASLSLIMLGRHVLTREEWRTDETD